MRNNRLVSLSLLSVLLLSACSNTTQSKQNESTDKIDVVKQIDKEPQIIENQTDNKSNQKDLSFSSTKYADTDIFEISINGKMYELGKSTLQELIDDGVLFREGDLNNATNNVDSNSQSDTFRIVLDDYWDLQIWTSNFSDSSKPANELPISDIYYVQKQDQSQNIVSFNFPFDLTIEDLKSNSGEPTNVNHYDSNDGYTSDNIDYKTQSINYYKEKGYTFGFIREKFDSVRITYLP